jgi:hypothetical protein
MKMRQTQIVPAPAKGRPKKVMEAMVLVPRLNIWGMGASRGTGRRAAVPEFRVVGDFEPLEWALKASPAPAPPWEGGGPSGAATWRSCAAGRRELPGIPVQAGRPAEQGFQTRLFKKKLFGNCPAGELQLWCRRLPARLTPGKWGREVGDWRVRMDASSSEFSA